MSTDGIFLERPQDKNIKIEVYGDSITTGFNNMRTTLQENSSTDKLQNVLQTYAWIAAQNLDADISIHARVGIGLTWSWGANYQMKSAYKDIYCSEREFIDKATIKSWDFNKYTPNIVLINVGTNDTWNNTAGGFNRTEYQQSLITLINELSQNYPESNFVLLYGMMTSANEVQINQVVNFLKNSVNVSLMRLPQSSGGHPRVNDNEKAATALTNYLRNLIA